MGFREHFHKAMETVQRAVRAPIHRITTKAVEDAVDLIGDPRLSQLVRDFVSLDQQGFPKLRDEFEAELAKGIGTLLASVIAKYEAKVSERKEVARRIAETQ